LFASPSPVGAVVNNIFGVTRSAPIPGGLGLVDPEKSVVRVAPK